MENGTHFAKRNESKLDINTTLLLILFFWIKCTKYGIRLSICDICILSYNNICYIFLGPGPLAPEILEAHPRMAFIGSKNDKAFYIERVKVMWKKD